MRQWHLAPEKPCRAAWPLYPLALPLQHDGFELNRRERFTSPRLRGEGEVGPPSRPKLTLSSRYPLALPTVFLATGFATLAGEVVAEAVTGARALLAASDFGFAADFFATAFLAGFGALAAASTLAGFAALAFLAPRFGLPPPLATRSSISAMVSWVLSLGIVALTPPAVT